MTDYCGQRDVCAEAPGCGWYWAQRVCEVMAERDAALAELREAEADVVELGAAVAAAIAERDAAREALRAVYEEATDPVRCNHVISGEKYHSHHFSEPCRALVSNVLRVAATEGWDEPDAGAVTVGDLCGLRRVKP